MMRIHNGQWTIDNEAKMKQYFLLYKFYVTAIAYSFIITANGKYYIIIHFKIKKVAYICLHMRLV